MIMSALANIEMSSSLETVGLQEGQMVREDGVIMSVKELRRVHVIRQAMEKKLTQVQAGIVLG